MQPVGFDVLLESRQAGPNGGCKSRLHADTTRWEAVGAGAELLRKNSQIVDEMSNACGFDVRTSATASNGAESLAKAFKDVTDLLVADRDESFDSMQGITKESLTRFESLAQQLLQSRLFGTTEQIVYVSGELPHEIVRNLYAGVRATLASSTAAGVSASPYFRFYSYHAHREMMYSIAHFFQIPIETHPRIGAGWILPPGSAYFIELHDRQPINTKPSQSYVPPSFVSAASETASPVTAAAFSSLTKSAVADRYFVRVNVWTPCGSDDGACPYTHVQLSGCATVNCSLLEFQSIVTDRIASVDADWTDLCSYQSYRDLQSQSVSLSDDVSRLNGQQTLYLAIFCVLALVTCTGCVWYCQRQRHFPYTELTTSITHARDDQL